ncbi:MAG: AAA domain-containing protein [Candidatus Aminicenantes bacterium]|nr:AAA domain-containing protein [Candidatus Aminicenantes bacterium]
MKPVEAQVLGKSTALLRFLKDTATIRRKRIPTYGEGDKLLWFAEVPRDRTECRSAFHAANPAEFPDMWLEIHKKRMPSRPPVPEVVKDWVRPQDLDQADQEPKLLPEITVLIKRRVPDPDAPPDQGRTVTEEVGEVRRLKDHPEIEDAWLEYLVNQWEPWAQEMRPWQEVQRIYEGVDFMRRRLEEAEERYELVLALGLLQWRDSTNATVKRHLLTAPAEISLDAARGVLAVGPAASFEKFRIELDMLELQNQPRLEETGLDDRLEELDVQAWDRMKVGEILRVIANRASPNAQVDENSLKPLERADETFRVSYAPALVLRERRPTAYEELINRFLKAFESESSLTITGPWGRFVREGEPSMDPPDGRPHDDFGSGYAGGRLYFPLPTNEEQRRIAERLKAHPYVLVKGPPGTGKSHTIANLICHLLASGDRVLVTAHAPKALTVLRELLPGDIRNLCVTAFGSTRDDQKLLENSVRGILGRKNEWKGEKWAQEKIAELERELCQLEDKRAQVERGLRECREAETHSHTLLGGYQGTAAQIARLVEADRETYGWFPEVSDGQSPCPLQPAGIALLAEVHSGLTEERLNELGLDIGGVPLPDPQALGQATAKLEVAEHAAEAARKGLPQEQFDRLEPFSDVHLDTCRAFLNELEEHYVRASRVLGDLTYEIVKDLLVGQELRWNRLAQDMAALLKSMDAACGRAGTARVDLPLDFEQQRLLFDARRRQDHFRKGGWRGLGFLAPGVVRETRYVEKRCQVDGKAPRGSKSLEMLAAFLELKILIEQFSQICPVPTAIDHLDPRRAVRGAEDLAQELNRLLELFRNRGSDALAVVPIGKRVTLTEPNERHEWLGLIEAEMAIRLARLAKEPLEAWLRSIRTLHDDTVHPCMQQMAQAIEGRSVERWKTAWEIRERLKAEKEGFRCYQELVDQLQQASPIVKKLLISSQGDPEWRDRLLQLEKAWAWTAARAWLRRVSDSDTCRSLGAKRHRLQDSIEKKVEELAALRAWHVFFERLDDPTEQYLKAWAKVVSDRIRKGTGKYACKHRRTARQYLMNCIPKIPAWIMPLHKLWETTDAVPGIFDTIIIDEASQAGIESIALFLLAKRIIVVGDDKQNSPEAVGVLEEDIERLARKHLSDFRFRGEFRPDTSLFDHADRGFGNPISLREHFRCVPEIIRFSNELCYTDAPLIPLRQPPPNRLQPLRATFVDSGSCEGDGQRIINRAEVEAIVKAIQECIGDDAYEGKTMGVIVLQGHAQAELIEKKLAEMLEPKIREERRLRCGVPATFQGDQRDVMFLSLVLAPDHRSRALTGLPDQRRFNVAMSRAKDQVWLFHGVQQHDLSREDLRWRLLSFFSGRGLEREVYEEIDRLEREARRLPRHLGEQPAPYDSWFEVDVALELLRRTYRVRPQWKVAEKRIDLVVEGLENRLAVECYGDAWHGPEEYEHDMARQRQLERAGWTFVVIRESEFYADRNRAMQQVMEECERLGIRPANQHQAPALQKSTLEAPSISARTKLADDGDLVRQPDAESEGAAFPEGESVSEFGPFTGYSAECGFPDPRQASPANVRVALRQIIEKDGPVTRGSLYRLYVEGCPDLQRVGKAVRQALNRALGTMLRSGEIVQEDELGDGSPEGLVVRLAGAPKVLERPAGRRDLLEIPPPELFLVLDRIRASSTSAVQDDDTLARALLGHYGFTRLTEVRRKHLARILDVHHRQR